MKRINRLRNELSELARQYGFQHPKVIRKSQQLDKLIVQYMKKIPRRKAPYIPMKPLDEDKMKCYMSKVRSSLKRDVDEFFKQLEQLQIEIMELADKHHLFDPVVTEKSRELDKLIMNFIRPK